MPGDGPSLSHEMLFNNYKLVNRPMDKLGARVVCDKPGRNERNSVAKGWNFDPPAKDPHDIDGKRITGLNPYRITIETDKIGGSGLTELYIDERRSMILVHPKIDLSRTLDDPEVGHEWKVLKGRMREFAEYVLANGHDNSTGACLEQIAREACTGSENFHIEAYIGSAGNEEAVDLYIDGDTVVSLVVPNRGVGQPGSDTVAFIDGGHGPELIGRWEELKGHIKGFAGSLTSMRTHRKIAYNLSRL